MTFGNEGAGAADPLAPLSYDDIVTKYSDDLDEDEGAMPTTTTRKAAVSGGEYSVGGKDYWIPGELYQEVLDRDNQTPLTRKGDKEFGKWLKAFIKDHADRITEVKKDYTRTWSQKSMSGYWAMPYAKWNKGTSENTVRLATVLRAMRTVLSVVDPAHKLSVKYVESAQTSSWMDNTVHLPTKPATEIKDLEEAINVMSGFAIHEAWHSEFTRPLIDTDCRAWLKADGWNKVLLNIPEDVREETLGLQKTPGYRNYLNYTMEFLWNDKGVPKKWDTADTEDGAKHRVQAFFMFLREPDRAEELLTNKSFAEPKRYITDWMERYMQTVNEDTRFSVALPFYNEMRAYLALPESPPPPDIIVMTPCGYTGDDPGADEVQQEEVAEALESETEEVAESMWSRIFGERKHPNDKVRPYGGDTMSNAVIIKPRVTNPNDYKPMKSNMIEKAKATLALRKATPQPDTRLMKHGTLDEDELYRFFENDMRIFKDATVAADPNAAIYLLVDMSGSMGYAAHEGYSAYWAARIAQLFLEGLATHPNVRVRVLGHTGDNDDCENGGAFYRIWEKGDPINRLSILYNSDLMGDNYDGYAIGWAGELIKKEPVDQRLIIVLADGQPAGYGYGDEEAMDHVRSVTDRLARQGVDVVQVAVGSGIPREHQERMFKHFIELRDDGGDPFAKMFRELTKVLRRFV